MTRLLLRIVGRGFRAYLFVLFALVLFLGAAWYAIAGFFYGLAKFPGLGALAATATLAAYLAVHPDRTPTILGRKVNQ
jgi:hypothetical protein